MTRIAVVFAFLLALDAATTFVALTFFGAVELNPLGPVVGILGKGVAVVVILALVRLADPDGGSVRQRRERWLCSSRSPGTSRS